MSRHLFATLGPSSWLDVERQFDSWGPNDAYDLSAYADVITVCKR